MAALDFSTGLVTYTINGGAEVRFNPADAAFVERLYNTFERLDKVQDRYRAEIESAAGSAKIFDIARQRSGEMRRMIDELFQAEVSTAIFGDMNLYALADGLPVWANLLLAVMDAVDENMAEQQKQTSPRVQKYVDKYKKYHK